MAMTKGDDKNRRRHAPRVGAPTTHPPTDPPRLATHLGKDGAAGIRRVVDAQADGLVVYQRRDLVQVSLPSTLGLGRWGWGQR